MGNVKEEQWIFRAGCNGMREIKHATLTRNPPLHLTPKQLRGLTSLVQRMLQKNMTQRPRAPCVLKDTWFQVKEPVVSNKFGWLGRLMQRRRTIKEPAANFFSSVIDDAYFNSVPPQIGGA